MLVLEGPVIPSRSEHRSYVVKTRLVQALHDGVYAICHFDDLVVLEVCDYVDQSK